MKRILAMSRTRQRRVFRVRTKLAKRGCPRLTVHSTGRHIYAQVIDDSLGTTIAAASSCEASVSISLKSGGNVEAACFVGRVVAERAIAAGVGDVVFDRGGRKFHGRVAAVANSARSVGLKF